MLETIVTIFAWILAIGLVGTTAIAAVAVLISRVIQAEKEDTK